MLARLLLTLAASAAVLSAQNDYSLDKTSPARLGGSLDLAVTGAPGNQLILYVVSTNGGPVPLAAIDPLDGRFMEVGADLLDILTVAATTPTGQSSISVPLPVDPALHGGVLHWQSVMLQLGVNFFGQLGNKVVTQLGLQAVPTTAPAALANARAFAAGLVDANNNAGAGDVLITGGGGGTLTAATGLATTELFDFRRLARTPGPTMSTARALHLAVRLADNRVLLIGGADATGIVLSSCEIYDPTTNTFTPGPNMLEARALHTSTTLTNGQVLIAGGISLLPIVNIPTVSATAYRFNPANNSFGLPAFFSGARFLHSAAPLSNGRVLLVGGLTLDFTAFLTSGQITDLVIGTRTDCQMFQTGLLGFGTFTTVNGMQVGRAGAAVAPLPNGGALIAGGFQLTLDIPNNTFAANATATADVFSQSPLGFTPTGSMAAPRLFPTALNLPDGTIMVVGGGPTDAEIYQR